MNSDLELVAQTANSGNKEAFAQLVERHQSRIRQFLRRITAGDWHAADDIAQDTFLIAYQKIHQFKGKGTFAAWLRSIAWRLFINLQRQKTRRGESALVGEFPAGGEGALEAELTAQRLMRVLSDDQRVVVTLSYSEGFTHEQIGNITGMPVGTVKSHLSRAISKMKRWVDTHDNEQSRMPVTAGSEEKRHVG